MLRMKYVKVTAFYLDHKKERDKRLSYKSENYNYAKPFVSNGTESQSQLGFLLIDRGNLKNNIPNK